jgi:hypothetical protein
MATVYSVVSSTFSDDTKQTSVKFTTTDSVRAYDVLGMFIGEYMDMLENPECPDCDIEIGSHIGVTSKLCKDHSNKNKNVSIIVQENIPDNLRTPLDDESGISDNIYWTVADNGDSVKRNGDIMCKATK